MGDASWTLFRSADNTATYRHHSRPALTFKAKMFIRSPVFGRTRSIQLEWPYNFDDSTLLPILGRPSHSIQRPINLSAEEI
jgi:hypothetical protein